jgi:serine/threonine protein kinase
MHQDISPNNLLVFSSSPPIAAIYDFGKSKHDPMGNQASLGPRLFATPEPNSSKYSNTMDVFNTGLSILAIFQKIKWPGPLSKPDNHAQVLAHFASLHDSMPDDLVALIRSILAWDPTKRPTAEEAPAHRLWQQAAAVESGSEPDTAGETTGNRSSSSGLSPSSADGTNGFNKRFRRSDAPSASQMDHNKRPRRSRSSATLLSPPPLG